MRLEGKVAIVTGGGRGIGRAICLKLAREGAKVIIADIIDTSATVREIEEQGGTAIGLHADVTSEQDTRRLAEETISRFGRIDALVNNAAIFYGLERVPFEQLDPADWDRMMAVNVKGCWLCAKAVVPQMKQQGKGKIINISSGSLFVGTPGMLHYVSSKGAVMAMSFAMATELGPHNICVNAVGPGFTMSEAGKTMRTEEQAQQLAEQRQTIKRPERPEDIAGTVAFLTSDEADMITGQMILVDGGTVRH